MLTPFHMMIVGANFFPWTVGPLRNGRTPPSLVPSPLHVINICTRKSSKILLKICINYLYIRHLYGLYGAMDDEEKTDLLREAIHDITNIFSGEENTETLFEYVRNILPIKQENYKILY